MDMEAAVATKFVKWEVPTLESLHECKVYRLRMKVNNGELVSQYGQWREYKVMDKTALRKILYGRIDRIVELDKRHPK